jgi:hypothetical protein
MLLPISSAVNQLLSKLFDKADALSQRPLVGAVLSGRQVK